VSVINLLRPRPGFTPFPYTTLFRSNLTGGDSIANTSANGGNGGDVRASIDPVATSGGSGASTAQSSATNTGNTGPASSSAISNPQADPAASGPSRATGVSSADLTAT